MLSYDEVEDTKNRVLEEGKRLNQVIEKMTLNKIFLSIFKIKAHKCQYKFKNIMDYSWMTFINNLDHKT